MSARVLLVDDEPPIVVVLATTLRAHGYQVRTAETAQDALLALAEEIPDVMLLDINLSDLTGWELLRRLSPVDRQRVPVIVFSASPLAPSRVEEFKPSGVLTKPFPVDALLRLLEETTGARSSEGTRTDA
ncbi:MAG: response regulator [Dehalococcoidia bacterium]